MDMVGLARAISEKKVLVVGELLVDMISENNIESLAVSSGFSINQGGSSANLCANLKWLGVDAVLVATVGDDNLGSFLINELKTVGLSDQYINRCICRQTSLVLIGKNEKTPDFIPYRNADIAINRVDDTAIATSGIIHTTAFALSKAPARNTILQAFEKAAQLGKFLSVDWNFAPSIWQEDDGKDVFKKLMNMNPLLKISLDDLERFTGMNLSINQAINWLGSSSVGIICLTCGKDGVWFKLKNQEWQHKSALPVSSVIGVTGAGDAFWSGFLAAFINEMTICACIDKALEVAKLKIEQSYPLYKNETVIYPNFIK